VDDAKQYWLVEILLPITHNDGSPVADDVLHGIHQQLVSRFGGLTAFTRSPAEGIWRSDEGASHDDIVVLEVMSERLDRGWWREWRERLEALLQQKEIVIRALPIERL
jgi:hypothetical protein